jgi:hypothetical protein
MEGIEIVDHPQLGKVAKAAMNFRMGDTVMEEVPQFRFYDDLSLLRQYHQLDDAEREATLGNYYHIEHPDLCPPEHKELRTRLFSTWRQAESISRLQIFPKMGIRDIFRLLSIGIFNSHEFCGTDNSYGEFVTDKMMGEDSRPKGSSALFPIMSKVAHSCNPNCTYSSRSGVYGQYIAVRDIRKGALVTFAYIDTNLSTEDRRKICLGSKGFLCQCPRCLLPDPKSARFCKKPCGGASLCDGDGNWLCSNCSSSAIPSSSAEREILVLAEKIRAARSVSPDIIYFTKQAISKSLKLLPSTHYLISELYAHLSTMYASVASLRQLSSSKQESSMIESIVAGMRGHKLQECAAHSCLKGEQCNETHAPCIENIDSNLWQGMMVLKLSRKQQELLPDGILEMLLKYDPLSRVHWGPQDADCVMIAITILEVIEEKRKGKRNSKDKAGSSEIKSSSSVVVPEARPIVVLKTPVKQEMTDEELQALADEIEGTGVSEGGQKKKGKTKAKGKKRK